MYKVHYAVNGTITKDTRNIQIPTFYLCANVQGIVSTEHAMQIAKEIVNPFNDLDVNLSVVRV